MDRAHRCLLRSETATVAGLRWHARVGADTAPSGAPPIVLVHGLGVSSQYFEPTTERLAPHFPTYAPDLPGFGRSERPRPAFGISGLAEALVGWMDAHELPTVVLLGNSVGCQIVVEVAFRHPTRVSRLVLTGPTGDPTRSLGSALLRLLVDIPRESVRMVAVEAVDYLRAGPRRLVATARSMAADPFAAKLPLIHQPTLVMRGDRDPIAPQHWVEQVVGALPDARLEVVPGATHVVNYSAPDVLVAATRAFLAEGRPVRKAATSGG